MVMKLEKYHFCTNLKVMAIKKNKIQQIMESIGYGLCVTTYTTLLTNERTEPK